MIKRKINMARETIIEKDHGIEKLSIGEDTIIEKEVI